MDVIANKQDAVYAHQMAIFGTKIMNLLQIAPVDRPKYLQLFMGWSTAESMPKDALTKIKVDTCQRLASRFQSCSWWQWDAILKEEIQMYSLKLMMISSEQPRSVAVTKVTAAMRKSSTAVSLPVPAVKE